MINCVERAKQFCCLKPKKPLLQSDLFVHLALFSEQARHVPATSKGHARRQRILAAAGGMCPVSPGIVVARG